MQDNLTKSELLSGIEVGRENEEMCLLARLFNGFANSTRLSILSLLAHGAAMRARALLARCSAAPAAPPGLSILLLLVQRGEMKVGELVEELGAPQPRVSDHLRCLAWGGWVRGRGRGRRPGWP